MSASDVIVVGGGVIGCAIAHALARARIPVTLLERDAIGAHASSAAAGMLAPYVESGGEGALFALGEPALRCFHEQIDELRELSGIDPALQLGGVLEVRRADGARSLARRAARLTHLDVERLDRAQLAARVKGLADDIEIGLWSPREGHVDARRLTQALARAAERRGATLEPGIPVLELIERGGRIAGVRTPAGPRFAAHVVWATGAWAASCAPLRASIPVEPIKGQILELDPAPLGPPCIVWDEAVYLVPRSASELRVGATVERAGFDVTPTAGGVSQLLSGAIALLPALAGARFRAGWSGLRPASPDGLPLLGPLAELEGLTLAVGHHRNGILLSLWTGEALARWIAHAERDALLVACDPARFDTAARREECFL
jgi:glycine oxidase